MQDDPFYDYANKIVEKKGELPIELKRSMVAEIVTSLNDIFNAEIISRLSLEGLDAFNKLLDEGADPNKVTQFIEDSGIDIQNALTVAMAKFNKAYLGKS